MAEVLPELEALGARELPGNAQNLLDHGTSQLGGFLAGVSAVSV